VVALLEDGEYESPVPMQDLVSGVQKVTLAGLALKQFDDVDPDVELNFLNWVTEARNILSIGEETPPNMDPASSVPGLAPTPDPMMGGMGGMPPGPGMPMGAGPPAVPVPEPSGLATQPSGLPPGIG